MRSYWKNNPLHGDISSYKSKTPSALFLIYRKQPLMCHDLQVATSKFSERWKTPEHPTSHHCTCHTNCVGACVTVTPDIGCRFYYVGCTAAPYSPFSLYHLKLISNLPWPFSWKNRDFEVRVLWNALRHLLHGATIETPSIFSSALSFDCFWIWPWFFFSFFL